MDILELWNGTTKALIDPVGAWLTNLSDDSGDILYPKRTRTTPTGEAKDRGGCHVCLPNFGPGGQSGLPQHGFGRTAVWLPGDVTPTSAELELTGGAPAYEALVSRIQYTLHPSSLHIRLQLTNNGTTNLRVAPGFHPYFALDRDENNVLLNGQTYTTADLAGTEFFNNRTAMNLTTKRRIISITSDGLPTWAFWTDRLGDYVCVEPTVGGYTFLETQATDEVLGSGDARVYGVSLQW